MKLLLPTIASLSLLLLTACSSTTGAKALLPQLPELNESDKTKIAHKIWKNESGGSIDGLVSWNEGENFASLGIGHFIWYPQNVKGPFDESFPTFIDFVKARKPSALPKWLDSVEDCPWNDREEFLSQRSSLEVYSLKSFLSKELTLQADFIIARSRVALPKMLNQVPEKKRADFIAKYKALSQTSIGQYALIDYVNFKGEGTKASERYKGKGWGLLQVIEKMRLDLHPNANIAFAEAAKFVLERRVHLSPEERNEERWLKGWHARCDTYKKAL